MTNLPLAEKEIIDAYIYVLARYLVIRQEHIDMAEESVDYNVIKFNELGKAEFFNPNLDVAYLEAWFAVDENTPVILEIPKIEGHYYTAQIMDEWAEIITNINERNYPEHPYGRYALCLKGSNPEVPEGALRVELPSKKSKMLARVERQGDDEGAVKLQRAFKIIKTGEPVIDPAVPIPMFTNQELITVDVFNQHLVEGVLASAPDAVSTAADYQKNVLNIADYVGMDVTDKAAIDAIIKGKAFPYLLSLVTGEVRGDSRGGWASTREWLAFGDDVEFRCSVNYAGIWWNSSAEVVYYMGFKDESGVALSGDNIYYCETELTGGVGRIQLFGLDDLPNVLQIQKGYKIVTLSEFLGEEPKSTPETDWLPWKDEILSSVEFIDYFNYLIPFCEPIQKNDQEAMARFARIGIASGAVFDRSAFGAEIVKAIEAGIAEAIKKIAHKAENITEQVNGWNMMEAFGPREFFKGDWLLRAAAAMAAIFANDKIEAFYPMVYVVADGGVLDGTVNQYTLHFKKDEIPPAKYFWSVTMYDKRADGTTGYLVDNPIDRYLVNSTTAGLVYGEDGSLSIHIQHEQPEGEKAAKWLPAPSAPFYMAMRIYGPEESVMNNEWAPPAVHKVN